MEKSVNKFIYWTPRILSIIFILFLTIFSLDVFDAELGFWGTIAGLFMHNIPVFILAIVLWISWKREIVGGIVFIIFGIFFTVRMLATMITNQFELAGLSQLIIAGPAFFVGILFIINWQKKRKSIKINGI